MARPRHLRLPPAVQQAQDGLNAAPPALTEPPRQAAGAPSNAPLDRRSTADPSWAAAGARWQSNTPLITPKASPYRLRTGRRVPSRGGTRGAPPAGPRRALGAVRGEGPTRERRGNPRRGRAGGPASRVSTGGLEAHHAEDCAEAGDAHGHSDADGRVRHERLTERLRLWRERLLRRRRRLVRGRRRWQRRRHRPRERRRRRRGGGGWIGGRPPLSHNLRILFPSGARQTTFDGSRGARHSTERASGQHDV